MAAMIDALAAVGVAQVAVSARMWVLVDVSSVAVQERVPAHSSDGSGRPKPASVCSYCVGSARDIGGR